MTFSIQGWLFRNPKKEISNKILDIGTTTLVTDELEHRLEGLIDHAAPLTSLYGSLYKNPRQYATSHIRILKAFVTVPIGNNHFNFRVQKENYNSFNLNTNREYYLTFDGYNFNNAKALLVPKNKTNVS